MAVAAAIHGSGGNWPGSWVVTVMREAAWVPGWTMGLYSAGQCDRLSLGEGPLQGS